MSTDAGWAPVAGCTGWSPFGQTHSVFSAIDSRASAVVVMAGCRTLSSPHGDRASAAVLLVGGLLCEVMAGALWCCVASVFGAVGCSRAGETAGISRFAAGPVLDRSFSPAPGAGPVGVIVPRPGPGSVAGGFAGAMPSGSRRWWVPHRGIPFEHTGGTS